MIRLVFALAGLAVIAAAAWQFIAIVRPAAENDNAFTTVWRPGAGLQWMHWDMSGDAFKTQDLAYLAQGLRISALQIRNGRIAALWRPGDGVQWVYWGMSDSEFKSRDMTYIGQGLRITSLAIEN